MTRRSLQYIPFFAVFLLLAGCSPANAPIDPANSMWDRFAVGPLSSALDWFADLMWGSYGLSILVVTIIIRFIILPLTLKQYRSSKRMQDLQPEMKKIKDKYKDDPKKQQEETMKLFQKEGVNPLAGCLPVLVQMPILIALYNAIMRNTEIGTHSFLWMQLGTKDPYYILPLLAALTTYLQQKVMSSQMNPQMQSLMFIFPILIFVMAMNFASALPLYWVYSNIFTIVQSYFLYRQPKDGSVKK
ncbi:membrane protein insertase YidC [Paenibacillus mucilaginosus]|uniref:Membrane protein insertase YidC n=3 Tax=Paenibacillus mucilaginosus TaxID=61624 RepID=H6NJ02_9BACL|nr:membrane protein insertase YidC [Paenibacillus mucilaginosus]AEI46458.1 60 kDa inner membrane insertion protein [Paenibacillus mucilaginosus KNP414]AFC34052.1 60 kDa inner membrane insertion protein [Paenibacillus mucilaginosus 3016]AFH66380.1 membrane protein [Paenibacillus mucilaginosus K02]MCG7213437.1 membrane protein insertase YidC [Paenibacillus mucilaginosus]WDM27744.1 membrane protein insertase YidC [Paenibacillus mucilaginosus]